MFLGKIDVKSFLPNKYIPEIEKKGNLIERKWEKSHDMSMCTYWFLCYGQLRMFVVCVLRHRFWFVREMQTEVLFQKLCVAEVEETSYCSTHAERRKSGRTSTQWVSVPFQSAFIFGSYFQLSKFSNRVSIIRGYIDLIKFAAYSLYGCCVYRIFFLHILLVLFCITIYRVIEKDGRVLKPL